MEFSSPSSEEFSSSLLEEESLSESSRMTGLFFLEDCLLVGSARTDNSRIEPSRVDDCTSFSIKSSRLMGADVPDLSCT